MSTFFSEALLVTTWRSLISHQTLARSSKWPKTKRSKRYLIKTTTSWRVVVFLLFFLLPWSRYQKLIRLSVNPFSSPGRIFFSVCMRIQPVVCYKKKTRMKAAQRALFCMARSSRTRTESRGRALYASTHLERAQFVTRAEMITNCVTVV